MGCFRAQHMCQRNKTSLSKILIHRNHSSFGPAFLLCVQLMIWTRVYTFCLKFLWRVLLPAGTAYTLRSSMSKLIFVSSRNDYCSFSCHQMTKRFTFSLLEILLSSLYMITLIFVIFANVLSDGFILLPVISD